MHKQSFNSIPFVKYSLNGNSFVIIDAIQSPVLPEKELSHFAKKATDTNLGIGADNLVVIQPNTPRVLGSINEAHQYWEYPPDLADANYVFRMFEPNGEEALCCGNALMCIANYLQIEYQVPSSRIVTEIPFQEPRTLSTGVTAETGESWVLFDKPSRMPVRLGDPAVLATVSRSLQHLCLEVDVHYHEVCHRLELPAYAVFTGEPHLVVNVDHVAHSEVPFRELIFAPSDIDELEEVERIGRYVNQHYRNVFPEGINVNFSLVMPDRRTIQHRSYERGIHKETLACGTGSVAVAFVSRFVQPALESDITIAPYLSAKENLPLFGVTNEADQWYLHGMAEFIYEGQYRRDYLDAGRSLAVNL